MTDLYGVICPLFDFSADVDEHLDSSSIYVRSATNSEKWYKKVNQNHTLQKSRRLRRVGWVFSDLRSVRSRNRQDAWDPDHSMGGHQV